MMSCGRLAEQAVVRPGVPRSKLERRVDRDVVAFGDDALGLFDHDPRFERALELRRDDARIVQRPFLEDADRGDVGERLRDLLVVVR